MGDGLWAMGGGRRAMGGTIGCLHGRMEFEVFGLIKHHNNLANAQPCSPKKYTALLDYLHENNQHYVPIIDAAIGIPDADDPEDEYFAYEKGTELDVWIKDKHGETYIGEVWPG